VLVMFPCRSSSTYLLVLEMQTIFSIKKGKKQEFLLSANAGSFICNDCLVLAVRIGGGGGLLSAFAFASNIFRRSLMLSVSVDGSGLVSL